MKNISELREIVKTIPGFLADDEGEFLYESARKCLKGTVIVEIGSWKGKSTVWLAHGSLAGNKLPVYAIDPHTGSSEHWRIFGSVWTYDEFCRNIVRAGVKEIIEPVVKTSEEAATEFKEKIGLLFIDGDHSYEMVKKDIKLWFPKLVEGGVISFHDTTAASFGVKKAVREFIGKNINFLVNVHFFGSILYATKTDRADWKTRLQIRYILLWHYFYSSAANIRLFRRFAKIGRRLAVLIQ